jgi:hypothetical protein
MKNIISTRIASKNGFTKITRAPSARRRSPRRLSRSRRRKLDRPIDSE